MIDGEMHFYEPRNGHGFRHDPFKAIIAPRPIGWISSLDSSGRANLAPYSYFNAFNHSPPIIGFSSIGDKDSVRNVRSTGEFVWNLATRTLAERMNLTSMEVPSEVDEFALAGLTPEPSHLVAPFRVRESPVNFECKATQIIALRTKEEHTLETWLVLGEVVGVHIKAEAMVGGKYSAEITRPIFRGGGHDYAEYSSTCRFEMRRPAPLT